MNIGNRYTSWMQNTAQAGYGNRSTRAGRTGAGKAFLMQDEKNDNSVTNGAGAESAKAEDMTYREQILAHMEEMAKKVKDGTVEPTFQTGAQSFTIKEWEKLLADFDDAEEALQEQIKALIAEAEAQAEREALRRKIESGTADPEEVTDVSVPAEVETAETGGVLTPASDRVAAPAAASVEATAKGENVSTERAADPEEVATLLTEEVTKCSYPTDDPKQKHWYITCYGQDGIWCKEAYMEDGKWVNRDCWRFSYTEAGQYEKVMAFLQRFPQDANLRFASHENFWKDLLAGEIDEDDFVTFFETSTKDGVPDYTYEKDGSTYVDREKIKYAKYMNGFGARLYTAEEMELIQRAIIHENQKHLQKVKISDYDDKMPIPAGGIGKADEEEDDMETEIITKPDGSTVLQIKTNFGVMEVEITEAQKFGLQYEARSGAMADRMKQAGPFARAAAADS
ncbi:MAG: hypothetical protein NC302_08895 [Bacteroidales bacterium]|nr:hypothetical protein [Bacteroidales bacterium]MCM1414867.1 hypothetical protein [bacterium]MCM1424082.1 hypothetical protein [bacterium]